MTKEEKAIMEQWLAEKKRKNIEMYVEFVLIPLSRVLLWAFIAALVIWAFVF